VTRGASLRERAGWWAAALAVPAAVIAFHWQAAMPGNAFVGPDLRSFFWAVREATAAALRAGHLPGWQRGIFLGYPLLADPQAADLDPGTLLTLPWDAPRALTLAALLRLCIGGWGMLAWLRWRGLAPLIGVPVERPDLDPLQLSGPERHKPPPPTSAQDSSRTRCLARFPQGCGAVRCR